MSRLSKGEIEFVTDFGDASPPAPPAQADAGAAPTPDAAPHEVAGGMLEIDARGISPPLPLLRAHRALRAMAPGQELRVITSHPKSMDEFQALAKHVTGYELVSQEVLGDEFVHVLRRRR